MHCPKCNSELEIFARGGQELYVCPLCLSALLPGELALQTLKYFCSQAIISQLISNLLDESLFDNMKKELGAAANLPCPKCKSSMKEYDFNNKLRFYVNKCASCGAIWINQMQMPLVAITFAGDQSDDVSFKKTVNNLYEILARKKVKPIRSLDEVLAPFAVLTGLIPVLPVRVPALPVGDNVLIKKRPVVTYGIIIICAVVFILQILFKEVTNAFSLIADKAGRGEWYRLVTHAFLHGGPLHIIGNMIFLRIFGQVVENELGRLKYALLFIIGAVLSGILFMATTSARDIPCVGASGAISAVMAAYLILFPKARIRFNLLHPLTFQKMGETRISSLYYILGWIIMNVTMGAFQSVTETAGIAWWGHIGGFIAGVVFAEAYKNLKPG